jgi:hypothetical protein
MGTGALGSFRSADWLRASREISASRVALLPRLSAAQSIGPPRGSGLSLFSTTTSARVQRSTFNVQRFTALPLHLLCSHICFVLRLVQALVSSSLPAAGSGTWRMPHCNRHARLALPRVFSQSVLMHSEFRGAPDQLSPRTLALYLCCLSSHAVASYFMTLKPRRSRRSSLPPTTLP